MPRRVEPRHGPTDPPRRALTRAPRSSLALAPPASARTVAARECLAASSRATATPTAPSGPHARAALDPLALAPLAFVFAMSFGVNKFSQATLQLMFWAFATVMGLSLSTIFLVYTGESIAATFFATAGAFAGLSLFGYTTKKDLSGMGTFLVMGVIGLLIAMVINMFLQSSTLALAVSFIGVLIFAGLTAYDTQRLKREYQYLRGTEFAGKAVIMGALSLYLDFINMFLFLLRFMGSRE